MSEDNLFYYSVNTYIAYIISERFYNSTHFVWVSPVFDPLKLDNFHIWKAIPATSSPSAIYKNLKQEVETGDRHSGKISDNIIGIKKGANFKLSEGLIDVDDLNRIVKMVDQAERREFKPLIYVIPKHLVEKKIVEVEVDKLANPLSTEYQIHKLKKEEFDIIEFEYNVQ